MDPASALSILNIYTNLTSLEDAFKESKNPAEVSEAHKKLESLARDFFAKLNANKTIVLREASHSQSYQLTLIEIGRVIRHLCPETFRVNQAAFEGLLKEATESQPKAVVRALRAEVKSVVTKRVTGMAKSSALLRDVVDISEANGEKTSLLPKTPFNPTIFNRYKSKFQAVLNIKRGICNRIQSFLKPHSIDERSPDELYGEYLTVAHLAENSGGMYLSDSVRSTIDLLEGSKLPYPDLIAQLKSVLSTKAALKGEEFREMMQKIKNGIANLRASKSMLIDSSTEKHAMLLQITRTGKHPKLFRIINHNSGSGINHHNRKIDNRGRQVYQRGFELAGVTEDRLLRSSFIADVLKLKRIDDEDLLYEQILPKLQGTPLPPKDDPRLWYRFQLGDTCSVGSIHSLLRSQMPEAHYREFMDVGRYEVLLKNYANIKKCIGNIHRQKIVALEIIDKLERRYRKHAVPFPEELVAVKNDLDLIGKPTKLYRPIEADFTREIEDVLPSRSKRRPAEVKGVTQAAISVTESLAQAFDMLFKAEFDPQKIPEVMKLLEPILAVRIVSNSEYRKLIAFALHTATLTNFPLTKNQIYTLTGILSLIASVIKNVQNNFSRKVYRKLRDDVQLQADYESFQTAFEVLHDKFNAMQLHIPREASYFQAQVDALIRKHQAKFYS